MAEAWGRSLFPDGWKSASAGIEKHGLNALMLAVMDEVGMDMSKHFSKTVDELPTDIQWDLVVTVCDRAATACPYYPGGKLIHIPFDDPPALAVGLPEAEALNIYRRVRDEIRAEIENLAKHLQ
ncbi:MAG: arsenate reductase ArsC [Akkermansia sp.]|nr:arsenate reductase ArsC [Akkermansia sp.]